MEQEHFVCCLRLPEDEQGAGEPVAYDQSLDLFELDARLDGDAPAKQKIVGATDEDRVCDWCTYGFEGAPARAPLQVRDGEIVCEGHFCSHACAAAHIFDARVPSSTMWERYCLLNEMAHDAVHTTVSHGVVRRAPPRSRLKRFGGNMTIEEFRCNERMHVVYPFPMCVVSREVEQVSSLELYKDNSSRFIPLDEERLNNYQAKLRRAKPKKHYKNTLDYSLQLVRDSERTDASRSLKDPEEFPALSAKLSRRDDEVPGQSQVVP